MGVGIGAVTVPKQTTSSSQQFNHSNQTCLFLCDPTTCIWVYLFPYPILRSLCTLSIQLAVGCHPTVLQHIPSIAHHIRVSSSVTNSLHGPCASTVNYENNKKNDYNNMFPCWNQEIGHSNAVNANNGPAGLGELNGDGQRVRDLAASILASYEQLIWLSTLRNEVTQMSSPHSRILIVLLWFYGNLYNACLQSIVQTRLYYESVLAGLPCVDPHVEWPTKYQEDPKSILGKPPASEEKVNAVFGSHPQPLALGEGRSSNKKSQAIGVRERKRSGHSLRRPL